MIDLTHGLPLEEPAIVLAWGVPLPRELPRAPRYPGDDAAVVRVFGERWRLVVARDGFGLEAPPGERQGVQLEPPDRADQIAAFGPHVLRRRAALVRVLGEGVVDPRPQQPCATARWTVPGGELVHEIAWITERNTDDGWLDDRLHVTRRFA